MAAMLLRGFMDEPEGFEPDDDRIGAPMRRHVELPAARERRESLGPDGADRGACQICALTDDSARSDRMPPSIEQFRRALRTQPDRLPEAEACKTLSSMFNRTCYRFDRESPNPVGVRAIGPRDVQRHLRETQHLRENEDRMLDDCIWYTLKMREQIERLDLWHAGADGEAVLDPNGFAYWSKVMESLRKHVELRHRVRNARDGVQKRSGRPRPHYSRMR